MRVTNIGLYSAAFGYDNGAGEEAIVFSLREADPSARYMVKNIVGLDTEELIPKFYGFGLYAKSKFYDFGLKARDIVIRIVLNPNFRVDESYSDVRDELYRAISSTRTGQVVLHFNSGATTVSRIFGFITKFEVGYFSELPEVQLTIRCDDAMFRAVNPVKYKPSELNTANPVIIPDSLSTAPHGFKFKVTFKAASSTFTIQDEATNPEWKFKIVPSGGFAIGDVLSFSSDYSNKYLEFTRAAVTTPLVDRIETGSIWPIIFPGKNEFHFVDIANFDWTSAEYYAAYWGV